MAEAQELQIINERFFHWSVYDSESKCDLTSTALVLKEGLVIFDPAPLAESQMKILLSKAPLRAVVLTNANHVRGLTTLKAFKVPIVTTAVTRKELSVLVPNPGIKPDVILLDKELLYGLAPIPIPGAAAGETLFHHKEAGVLVVGDCMLHVSPEQGLQFLPDKYCPDPALMRVSLRKVLDLEFHTMAFAHGTPIVGRAKDQIRQLLGA